MRARLTAFIATPPADGAAGGNRVTALRWAKRLRELGWHVVVADAWHGEPCDLLVALHAHKSHASIARLAVAHPSVPRVVALTGTDVYGELDHDAASLDSLALATRLIVLQPRALDRVPAGVRDRARVIRQSAAAARVAAPAGDFTACVLAHLRDVKDPLLAAHAAKLLPDDSRVRIVHVGAVHGEPWIAAARRAELESRGRWTWLGGKPRIEALRVLAASRVLVLTSRTEGGANVVTEAIAAGIPVLSTRIEGSLGILGDDYPGYFEVGDADGLARLLARCERDASFLDELRSRIHALAPLVDPARERAAWRAVLDELGWARGGG
ncbi:MAG TPA: selenoneine biosynthesis selenosugar synthase SenB [Kofleriaceae bacterium]